MRLLTRTNYSNRRVARETGLSRGTVNKLASGERPPVGKEDNYHAEPIVQEPPERCPECGYLVTMPCVACRTREYQRELTRERSLGANLGGRFALRGVRYENERQTVMPRLQLQ